MDDKEGEDSQKPTRHASTRSPKSYNFLIQLSRKLGMIATKSSIVNDVKSFLNHEISISPSERILGNTVPKIVMSKTHEDNLGHDSRISAPHLSKTSEKNEKGEELKKIVTKSHEVLMSANTVFPIDIFPDTVTVDRSKITITRRDFFWSSDVLSIRVEDVLNVQASLGPFFGSLTIAIRVMSTVDHFKISHLWRNDAIRLKRIIQGYGIAQHNNLEMSHLGTKELVETLIELGHDSNK